MDVVGGVELRERGLAQVLDVGDAGQVDDGRHVAHRQVADLDGLAVDERRGADQGVVAVPPGDLLEGDAGTRRQRREERRDRDLVVARPTTPAARRRARRPGSCAARPAPRPRASRRAASAPPASRRPRRRARASRPSCRGCGSWRARRGPAPARRAAAPGVRRREARTAACRASAPTRTPSSLDLDGVQARDPVDVDEQRRRREPHRQQRDQALAAGQHLGVRLAGQGRDRLGERPWPAVVERCWLHRTLVTSPDVRSVSPCLARSPGGSRRSPGSCRARCRSSAKSSVIFRVTPPMPAMMPAARPTRLTGLPKSTRFSTQILAPTQADHAVEHDGDAAEHTARGRVDDRAELRAQAEQDRDDRGHVVGGRRVDPGGTHDADVLGVRRGRRATERRWRARCATPSAPIARPM